VIECDGKDAAVEGADGNPAVAEGVANDGAGNDGLEIDGTENEGAAGEAAAVDGGATTGSAEAVIAPDGLTAYPLRNKPRATRSVPLDCSM